MKKKDRDKGKTLKDDRTQKIFLTNSNRTYIWLLAFFVAFITFTTYLPALKNGFVNWDDNLYIYENQNIQSLDIGFLKWCITAVVSSLWHPLTLVSLALDHAIWGLNPWGYHLTNILIHSTNTFLVFILVIQLLEYNNLWRDSKKALITGFITAILFGIHPVHVESVAWVSERKDVLSAFFYLSAMLAYIKYTSTTGLKKAALYSASILLFFFALLSKPMAISLPLVLLILDIYPIGRLTRNPRSTKWVLIEKLPFFLLAFLASVATVWAHSAQGGLRALETYPLVERIFVAVRAYLFYLVKMALPLNLAPWYPYPEKISFFTSEYAGALIALTIITIFATRSLKTNKVFFAIWFYYIITLAPTTGIVQVGGQAAADRYTYLPSLGPFIFTGLGVGYLFDRWSKRQYRLAAVVAVILLSTLLINTTVKQIAIWRDSITLWSYEIELFPESSAEIYSNRGLAYDGLGNYQYAIKDYNKAIELGPETAKIYISRGNTYDSLGDYQQAIKDYSKAIELAPQNAKAYVNRGRVYRSAGDYQQAIKDYSKAIEIDPRDAMTYYNRGNAYNNLGDYQLAIDDYTKSIEIDPQDVRTYTNRGNAYVSLGDYQEAIRDYSKAIEIDPQGKKAYSNLGAVYSRIGDTEQALFWYNKATNLRPKEVQDATR